MLLQSPLYKVVEIKNPKMSLVKKTDVKVGDLVQIYTDTHRDRGFQNQ